MKPLAECAPCILEWTFGRTASFLGENQKVELMNTLLGVLYDEFRVDRNVALIAKHTLDAVHSRVLAAGAVYDAIKKASNDAAKALLPEARRFVQEGKTPQECFERACYLASKGNVSPIAAPSGALEFSDAENLMAKRGPFPMVTGDVYEAARDKRHILFLFDNAGEIGFDALLIEQFKAMGAAVTLVLKEAPFFEDATLQDAVYFGLDKLSDRVLSVKTLFIPGQNRSSLDEAFEESDLVIAKGTFNFECLYGEDLGKPIIYMLKSKCGPISKKAGVDQGVFFVRLENA
ncbi:MAG: ARMT1-like domain-containing protein [Deltaproteobacteria bacterium]|nr:ARMT1-like domain-containing protein [Deltaproteobacteria bacterium]